MNIGSPAAPVGPIRARTEISPLPPEISQEQLVMSGVSRSETTP
jgi:hypothetical protein